MRFAEIETSLRSDLKRLEDKENDYFVNIQFNIRHLIEHKMWRFSLTANSTKRNDKAYVVRYMTDQEVKSWR